MTVDPAIASLQALVAAEDAAAFGLSALGGRLASLAPRSPSVAMLRSAYDLHRLRRDTWSATLRQRGADVPAAAAAYALPGLGGTGDAPGSGVEMAIDAAADIELRCVAAYDAALAGLTDAPSRTQVVAALIGSARQSTALLRLAGADPAAASQALPGQEG